MTQPQIHHLTKRLMRGLVVMALCLSIGLHWVALQSAAWVGMAVTYSMETGSLSQGLSETFDGEHPCPLCKMVELGKETENQSSDDKSAPTKVKEVKLTLVFAEIPRFVFAKFPAQVWITTSITADSRHERPVTPPPQQSC
jgi:hypothetical protein